MSVPKSQRGKSKVDFDNLILRLQENLVDAAEHHFYAKAEAYQEHKLFLDDKAREILAVGDLIQLTSQIFKEADYEDYRFYWEGLDGETGLY